MSTTPPPENPVAADLQAAITAVQELIAGIQQAVSELQANVATKIEEIKAKLPA